MMANFRDPPPPKSDVGSSVGLVGCVTLLALVWWARSVQLSPNLASLLFLYGVATVMAVWSIVVERVHLRPSTGLDYAIKRPRTEIITLTRVKLIGILATFLLIALAYFSIRYYNGPQFEFYFAVLRLGVPFIIITAPFYLYWSNRYLKDPYDELWHFGKLVTLQLDAVDLSAVNDHLRSWAIKAFFLAFMFSVLPISSRLVLSFGLSDTWPEPVAIIVFLVQLSFFFDACFGTVGYIMTFRPLDSHIRSANPFLAGWVVAMICYPPFVLMRNGGPLDYRAGTQEWVTWLDWNIPLLMIWGAAILLLSIIYAWATVIFGLRFSNLTYRGIITNGPYRYFRHPAYISKNAVWWLVHMPFLSTLSVVDALQSSILLLSVNFIYFLRAKTEERHLRSDPRYVEYCNWTKQNALFPRLFRWLHRLFGGRVPDA